MNKTLAAITSALVLSLAPGLGHATTPMASPEKTAANKELLAALNTREMVTEILAQLEQQMHRQAVAVAEATVAARTDLTAAQKAEALEKANAEVSKADAEVHAVVSDPALIDFVAAELGPLYHADFTLDEVRQMAAFFASPAGQKMQRYAPFVLKRAEETSRWMVKHRLPGGMPKEWQAIPVDPVPAPR